MCKYCEDKKEVIKDEKLDICNIEVFINDLGEIEVNTYNFINESPYEDSPVIATSVGINYYPICGRSLVEDKKDAFVDSLKRFKQDLNYDWKHVYETFYINNTSDYIFKTIWDFI